MAQDRQTSVILSLASTIGVAVAAIIVYLVVVSVDAGGSSLKFKNPSRSMEPTILMGDYVTARRLDEVAMDPALIRRGEIVLHLFPGDPAQTFMKRVIGLPGDTIEMKNGLVWINGHVLHESYTLTTDSADPVVDAFRWQRRYLVGDARRDTAQYVASRNNWGPVVVPDNNFFVLGDHRDMSLDSRYFGFVTAHQIFGSVRRVYFSRDSSRQIRWSRLGHLIQ
jgi:signal peptidase I